ncbi:spore germination protein [Fictibacillus nanhaiensis]|uniref:Ger(x)C family spore germination protein n=1 Tax=Fictibacillus nanhaiensis TaxID=742169 RepID=UPI003C2494CF
MFKKQREKTGKENNRNQGHSDPNAETTHWIEELSISNDFVNDYTSSDPTKPFWISYFRTLILSETLHRDVVPYLSEHHSLEEVKNDIPVQQIVQSSNSKLIKEKLLQGFAAIRLSEKDTECLLVSVANNKFRDISLPTMEATALGPQAAFVEEIDLSQNEVQYRLVNGQVRIAVIGEKLAEESLFPLLDTFSRSPEIGSLIQLAIVEGEASKLLSIKKYEKKTSLSIFRI